MDPARTLSSLLGLRREEVSSFPIPLHVHFHGGLRWRMQRTRSGSIRADRADYCALRHSRTAAAPATRLPSNTCICPTALQLYSMYYTSFKLSLFHSTGCLIALVTASDLVLGMLLSCSAYYLASSVHASINVEGAYRHASPSACR